jgi:transketolase
MNLSKFAPRMKTPPLDHRSRDLRQMVIDAIEGGERGHIGSPLSLIEILRVLYDDTLKFKSDNPNWADRDRCMLSKGHGCLALYSLLADKNFFDAVELFKFCHLEVARFV